MKILVKSNGHRITVPIPTAMIFNRLSVWLWLKFLRKHTIYDKESTRFFENIPDEAVYRLCDEILRVKRKNGCWDLVEVRSAAGDEVLIRL